MLLSLLILFAVKHFLADWQFQTTWMVRGKRHSGLRFIPPLSIHSLIHGLIIFYVITCWFLFVELSGQWKTALICGGIDFVSHSVIDRTKVLFEQISDNKKFRLELTFLDQLFHGSIYLGLIYYILFR